MVELQTWSPDSVQPRMFRPSDLSGPEFYRVLHRLGRRGLIESRPIGGAILRGGRYRKRVYRVAGHVRSRIVFETIQ